jgi:hypothetical protein
MTKLLQKAFEHARQLPDDQQDAAAGALLDYLDHMQSTHLTDEQVAEVRRRLADQNPTLLTLDEVKTRFPRSGE